MNKLIVLLFIYFSISTILFSQPVVFQWAKTYGTGNSSEERIAKIVTDTLGYVYTVGNVYHTAGNSSIVTQKYSPTGLLIWSSSYGSSGYNLPRDIILDRQGNIYITGLSGITNPSAPDLLVVKYNNTGVQQWDYRYRGSDQLGTNEGKKLALSVINDRLYVTGTIYNGQFGSGKDIVTIKLSSNGQMQWIKTFDKWHDYAVDIKVNQDNTNDRIAVAGTIDWGSNNSDIVGIMYRDSNNICTFVDTMFYAGPDLKADYPVGILLENGSNSVYVTGTNTAASGSVSMVTLKYNRNGNLLWTKLFSNTGLIYVSSGMFELFNMDKNNKLYAGCTFDSSGTRDMMLLKYDTAGTLLWNRRYISTGHDYVQDLDIDDSNNVYLCGDMNASGGTSKIGVVKYDQNGNLRWLQNYPESTPYSSGSSIEIDKNYNVYIGGSLSYNYWDHLLLKYSQGYQNSQIFARNNLNLLIPDPGSAFDTISVSNDNPAYTLVDVNVTIDTVIHPNISDLEFYLIHDGITDTLIYQAGGTGDNFIGTLLNDSASTPIANGTPPFTGSFKPSKPLSAFNSANHSGSWILKIYDRISGNTGTLKAWSLYLTYISSVGIVQISTEIPKGFSLSQNYPNPFNPNSKIVFQIAKLSKAKLIVYDIQGREAATLVNGELKAGTYRVDIDASQLSTGVYFYRLETEYFSETKKMMLIK
ncbi:MAG: T9SS type A sorting domain-containing protein [Ignavibacteria bacterium]|nr:T9SS type A sorting domain-containing protein [Ignavibacteria bacterium]